MKTVLFFCRDSYQVEKVKTSRKVGIYVSEDLTGVVCKDIKSGLKMMAKFDSEVGTETEPSDYWKSTDLDYSDECSSFDEMFDDVNE